MTIETLRASLDANVAARFDYEVGKGAHGAAEKIARYFAFDPKARACDVPDVALGAALECGVQSFDFLNDHKRESQRFNVYAAEKVRKALRGLASGSFAMLDKYSRAIAQTLLHNQAREGFYLGRKDCYALMCRDIETELKRSDMKGGVRVGAGTATTQVSSSLRAFAALGALRFDEETKRISDVKWDHPLFLLAQK